MEDKYKYQRDYHERNNLTANTFRMNKDVVNRFKSTCKKNGKTYASVLTDLMEEYTLNNK